MVPLIVPPCGQAQPGLRVAKTDREPQPVPVPSQATTAKPVGRGLGGPEGQGTATAGAKGDRFSRGGAGGQGTRSPATTHVSGRHTPAAGDAR
jgi:hypothetical protein